MASLQCLNDQMEKLATFLTPLLPLANTHNTDFITNDQLNNFLPVKMKEDLMNLEYDKVNLLPTARVFESCNKVGSGNFTSDTTLEEFLTNIRKLQADNLNLFTPLEKIQNSLVDNEFQTLAKVMREKKAHEVSHLCKVIASVCRDKGIHQVVDIGSGVGNLSSVLLLQYGLRVMAVDASSSNILSTLNRSKVIERALRKMNRAKRKKTNKEAVGKETSKTDEKLKQDQENREISKTWKREETENKILSEEKERSLKKTLNKEKLFNGTLNQDRERLRKETKTEKNFKKGQSVEDEATHQTKETKGECKDKKKLKFFCEFGGKFIGATKFVTEREDLLKLIVTSVTQSGNMFPFNLSDDLCVVGLHTCGNLAPTSLKIYTYNSNAKFICNISCCYHLLDEEFITDTFRVDKFLSSDNPEIKGHGRAIDQRYDTPELDPFHQKRSNVSTIGFPLSSFLKEAKFFLGRNARDLASKPVHRLSVDDKNLTFLFWRALFELIIKELHGSWPQNAFVGKIKDCASFHEYCRKGLKNIQLETKIEEEMISEYLEKYKSKKSELVRFYFLKTSLAPLIENLIHLDRLTFLIEQGYSNSHLVQIFDSAVSPRSTAIFSLK